MPKYPIHGELLFVIIFVERFIEKNVHYFFLRIAVQLTGVKCVRDKEAKKSIVGIKHEYLSDMKAKNFKTESSSIGPHKYSKITGPLLFIIFEHIVIFG